MAAIGIMKGARSWLRDAAPRMDTSQQPRNLAGGGDARKTMRCACLLLLTLTGLAAANTNTWLTASGTNDWFAGTNWSGGVAPADGDDAVITNANIGVLLTNTTAALSSLTIGNKATLIFTNWTTLLNVDFRTFPASFS